MKYEAVLRHSSEFDVVKMCKVLELNRSGYYKWLQSRQRRKKKEEEEKELIRLVEKAFEESDRISGYRNIYRDLQEEGIQISEYKVRKIMKENGFYPERATKFKPYRKGKTDGLYSEDLVKREFDVEEPNRVWAGDITYIKTEIGWVYLSVVMDLFNREIIGYMLSKSIDTQIVKDALGNAIGKAGVGKDMIFHSDRGVQYASKGFRKMLESHGISSSMSRPGCPYDNSCVESFFASLKKEKIYRRKYSTIEEVRKDIYWYIEMFYNRKRRHSSLEYMTPIAYRQRYDEMKAA